MFRRSLPKGLRRRRLSDGTFRYFLRTSSTSREITLYGDLNFALAQWRTHQIEVHLRRNTIIRITNLLWLFKTCEVPLRAPTVQSHLAKQIRSLDTYFRELGNPELTVSIPPVTSYLQWRGLSRLYRASGEVRLLVHVFSWTKAHTTVQAGKCPWTSEPVAEALRVPVLTELGTAMAFYGRQPLVDQQRNDALLDTIISDAPAPVCPVADAVTIRELMTPPELRDHSVKQLKLDGRPDYAAALSKLTEDEVLTALAFTGSAAEAGNGPRMILGTQRAARLAAFRLEDGAASKRATKDSEGRSKSPPGLSFK